MSRIIRSAFVAAAAGAAILGSAATATADEPPNCSAADMAGIMGGVSTAMSAYLFTHPDVNVHMSGMMGQSKEQRQADMKAYLDANPQVKAEVEAIRKPMTDFHERCGMDS